MAGLPQAIDWLLPELAADRGRGRAQTLLAIQGAGPDYVRLHLHEIDSCLGASSPGIAALADLVRQAEEAVATSRPTVLRQHVISQVVLRKFAEDVSGDRKLAKFDVLTGQVQFIGSRGVGYVENFVPVDSEATERLWGKVESCLNGAICAALRGSAVGNSADRLTLARAVALHFVRNPQTRAIHDESFAKVLARQAARWANTSFAAESFRRKYGLFAAGPEALRLGAEAAQGRLARLWEQGGLFRLSVQRMFEAVSDRFDGKGVEILIPASASAEFVLGDVPAVTVNTAKGALGLAEGVAVDQADEVIMPLSPRVLIVLGSRSGVRSIGDGEVEAYNEVQARMAKEYVVYRPGIALDVDTKMDEWRK